MATRGKDKVMARVVPQLGETQVRVASDVYDVINHKQDGRDDHVPLPFGL